ncbi:MULTISPECIES: hypothetical protein [unclassified Janthinobacterium]|uniref:hypothetical protein n=1 Tax=unclassified Janthinobacterium TaxID=2610881 RepID=UPI000B82E626|nr:MULTISPECIES: hypothetical protein [unclassified Janthinobacterium]
MAIFDIEKDDLLRLSETQLENFIARLAEAEVAAHGHSPAWVSWSGSINAPDEGIDIRVQVPVDKLNTGFLERADTILQAKKHSMPKGDVTNEMVTRGVLSSTIRAQGAKGGSYIIVSLADDCSPPMKNARMLAMRNALKDDPNKSNIHLDFYDRSKLVQWVRQHPSVMLWLKGQLGQGNSGWQAYGAWSNPPRGVDDTLISASGVSVTLPSQRHEKLSLENAIEPMRDLIRTTAKAVRITGLSGVGKTRIVQALFDEAVGKNALDRTLAVYVDTGANPDPSATAMLDRLVAERRRAVLILDNCPSELHSLLASRVSAAGGEVRLITVEYDIRDDKPQTTEVIHIEAVGSEMAEQLLIRRFPGIGQNNARRIAEFADGNARVSLAIAERVEAGESLAQLSDTQLFSRLFEQRNQPDNELREQAEIFSLVYSFSISNGEVGDQELDTLGSISGHSRTQLFRSVNKLSERHVVQKRAHWRAILPHAIANKLAASALDSIPVDKLRAVFERPGHQRLLMSFAHRLGLLHDHPVAKEIVETWLQSDGLLGKISELDEMSLRILDYISPVAPEALLDRIEAELSTPDFKGMHPRYKLQRTTILNLLRLLAYEAEAFDRCLRLLIRAADYEDESNNFDAVRAKISTFFQAYLSGTHASLGQRITIINECFSSEVAGRKSLGFRMLSAALGGPRWTGSVMSEFGARPRNFGFHPNHKELVEWRSAFVDVTVKLGTCGDTDLEGPARRTLANAFRVMWRQEAMRGKLVDAARKLHVYQPFGEGWRAVRSTINFDYSNRQGKENFHRLPEELAALDRELKPNDLVPSIKTYVLTKGSYGSLDTDFCHGGNNYDEAERRLQAKALRLGEDFATSAHELDELGSNLFSNDWMPYRATFGRGLAKGALDLRAGWRKLVEHLEQQTEASKNFAVLGGFIEETNSVNPALVQELLDQCLQHPELRQVLVGLHPQRDFKESDLSRCEVLLDHPATYLGMFGPIFWQDGYANLPARRVLNLAQRLLTKTNGDDVVLDALSMKLHDKDVALDTLGPELRLVGLRAAIQRLQRDQNDFGGNVDYAMENVVSAALRFDGNDTEKLVWLDTIFAVIDASYGHVYAFENAIQATIALMPKAFLDRAFQGTEKQQDLRLLFISNGSLEKPPLTQINVDELIEWCNARNDSSVWASVAAGITVWSNQGDTETVKLSDSAMKLLEASSNPEVVLDAIADRVLPSIWSGGLANAMEPRAAAIGMLVEHKNVKIAAAAKSISEKLANRIEREKEREQREHKEREQRFE